MEIYLDTANIDEIKDAAKTYMLSGVTTNPTLISKEGRDFKKVIKEIVTILKKYSEDFTVSAEVTEIENAASMIKQAKELAKIDKHILVKIPFGKEGLIAVKELAKNKIRCNVTLVFSSNQALLAAKAGAFCVSPFMGRLDDIGEDGIELIEQIRRVFDNYKFKTKILAASTRSNNHVKMCSLIGADIVTMPKKIFDNMYKHPLTDIGIESFKKDWVRYEKNLHK